MSNSEIEAGVNHLYLNDLALARIIKKIGKCNLQKHNDYYYSLLASIVSQQLSGKAADSIFGKLLKFFNNELNPEKVLITEDVTLRSLGLSNAKTKYVKDLSLKVINNEISFLNVNKMTNDEIVSELTKVKGIGVWTVHMFLIFTLGRLDVLPIGDLGIKRAIMLNYNLKKMPDEKKVIRIAAKYKWQPYSSIACWYLWKSLEK